MSSVSVVIPVLDDAQALAICLEHLGRQSVPPLEVVVVDNSASPGPHPTPWGDMPFELAVVHEPVRGVGAAASRGYDAARGAIIARCDADSRPSHDWVEVVARAFEDEPALDAATGPVAFYDLAGWRSTVGHAFYRLGLGVGMYLAIARTPLWGSNLAIRADSWRRVRARVHRDDPEVHDDLDLSFALGPLATVRRLPQMRVTAEARIFDSRAATRSRFARAMYTCRRGWAQHGPGHRWVCRLSGGRLLARREPTIGDAIPTTDGADR